MAARTTHGRACVRKRDVDRSRKAARPRVRADPRVAWRVHSVAVMHNRRSRILVSTGMVALALSMVTGCRPQTMPAEMPGEPTLEDIDQRAGAYYGRTVKLVGEIDDVQGQSFVLEGNDWLFDHDLLVISKTPMQPGKSGAIADDERVIVEGEVRQLVVADIERELGIDLDPELEVEFTGQPVIIADSVSSLNEGERWTAGDVGAAVQPQEPQETQEAPRVVAYSVYVADPVTYMGAAVQGTARVQEVISDRAFWVTDEEGRRALAVVREDVPQHEMIDIDAGQQIRFTGLVLPSKAMDDLAGTLEEDAKNAIRREPMFIAMYWKDVEILAGPQNPGESPKTGR